MIINFPPETVCNPPIKYQIAISCSPAFYKTNSRVIFWNNGHATKMVTRIRKQSKGISSQENDV
jgi:hypothetical protein